MRSTLWDFANGRALSQYILTLRKALSTHRGAEQSTTRPKPCIRVKAHSTPLPCYGIRPNPCLCTQCMVCVNIDTCNVQLQHAQFVLLLGVYMYCGCTNTYMSDMLCFTSSEVPNGVSGKACSGSYCTWLHQCGCYIWLDCSHIAPPYQG